MLTPYDLAIQARERAGAKARAFAEQLFQEGDTLYRAGDTAGAIAKWEDASKQYDLAYAYDGRRI